MSESTLPSPTPAPPVPPCAPAVVRLPVDKPQTAVEFLCRRGNGVMDLIAHFWERLAQTPPLARNDLHLVVAADGVVKKKYLDDATDKDAWRHWSGAMLYVPKAHRADVLALDPPTAAAFANYIAQIGTDTPIASVAPLREGGGSGGGQGDSGAGLPGASPATTGGSDAAGASPGAPTAPADEPANGTSPATPAPRTAIDFLTGLAEGIQEMIPHLLPLVHKRAPARQMVNIVMQLPPTAPVQSIAHVRLARAGDLPVLNRWRKAYKEERGILFDADLDAWVQSQRVFILEHEGNAVALAKLDLELARLVEIGGVYTFPEYRKHGFGGQIVTDLACRIRQAGKAPTLQVDRANEGALHLYSRLGWIQLGALARVWLTG